MKNIRPQIVVITGASAGLGRAIAHEFAKRGAHLGLIARDEAALNKTKKEVEALGGQADVYPLDVSEAERVMRAAEKIESKIGPIDIWVNNAMVSVFSPVAEMKHEEYKRVTDVSYLGYVYGTLAALRFMRPRNRGHIIQVGSALSHRSIPLQSAYCAAKHAINGFTESLRTELIHERSRINVSVVHMPAMNTPQFDWVLSRLPALPQPVPPIFQPEVGARAVLYTADHPQKEVFVGEPTWKAVLAEKFAPRIADWYLGRKGYRQQQIPGSKSEPQRPYNLWKPVPGVHRTHGKFDEQALAQSREFDLLHGTPKKIGLAAGALTGAALALLFYFQKRRGREREESLST